jgi:hypothetical protein
VIGSETAQQQDERVKANMQRLDDFVEFRQSRRNESDGPIPGILLTNRDTREWQEIIAHFGLFPFAFRRSEPGKGYVAIDFARRDMHPTRDFGYLSRYARNTMYVRGSLKRAPLMVGSARALIRQFRIAPSDLEMAFAIPRPLMAYLNWKAFKTCEQARIDPSEVSVCEGTLVRRGRTWVLRVDVFVRRNGQRVPVRGAG